VEQNILMNRSLDSAQIESYEENGFFFPKRVLSDEEVCASRACVQSLSERMGKLKRFDQCHLSFRWAYDLVTHPAVLDLMEDLLGPDILVHSSRIFFKHPQDASFVSWHLDGRYSGLNSYKAPTAWIALSESTVENGCLRVVRGSHKIKDCPFVERPNPDNLENHGQEVTVPIDAKQIVAMTLRPGEMSVHDVNIIHGSEPNRSSIPRIGFSISYVTPEIPSCKLPLIHARGKANCSHLPLAEPKLGEDLEASLAAHLSFLERLNVQKPRVTPPVQAS
jgi:non-heme Fe2+,alpha-ketoglutarate-dependent halogenase